eukprot:7383279-Prymnesium_polylepis.2
MAPAHRRTTRCGGAAPSRAAALKLSSPRRTRACRCSKRSSRSDCETAFITSVPLLETVQSEHGSARNGPVGLIAKRRSSGAWQRSKSSNLWSDCNSFRLSVGDYETAFINGGNRSSNIQDGRSSSSKSEVHTARRLVTLRCTRGPNGEATCDWLAPSTVVRGAWRRCGHEVM